MRVPTCRREELARAVKMHGKLITFGVVLHDVDGEVFWLNHNNHQFADELLRLLDQGAEPMAYLGATTGHYLYLNVLAGAGTPQKALGIIRAELAELYAVWPAVELHLAMAEKVARTVTPTIKRRIPNLADRDRRDQPRIWDHGTGPARCIYPLEP